MPHEYTVGSESEAFDLLDRIRTGELDFDDLRVKFDGWPVFEMHLAGPKYHSTITPSMMKAFIEFQKGIYRAYAYAKYSTYNVNKLTDDEKRQLEIAIQVGEGCSRFDVDLQELLNNFFSKAVDKMSSRELVVLVIMLAALYAGDSAYKAYLEERKNIRAEEVRREEQRDHLEAMQFMSEQETERMRIMAEFAREYPSVENAQRHAHDTATEMFKRAGGTADTIKLDGVELTGADAQLLTRNAQRKSSQVRLDGLYRLWEVNSSFASDFKVKVRNISTGSIFWAKLEGYTLTEANRAALQNAEWGKYPINLRINATDLSGEIRNAIVVGVSELSEEEKAAYLARHSAEGTGTGAEESDSSG